MIPAAPLVGAVTTRPPAAFSSFTASAYRFTQSMTASGSPPAPSSRGIEPDADKRAVEPGAPGAGPRAARAASPPRAARARCTPPSPPRSRSRPASISASDRQWRSLRRTIAGDRRALGAPRSRAARPRCGTGRGSSSTSGIAAVRRVAVRRQLPADHEAAADRVVACPRWTAVAVVVERREPQVVGVERRLAVGADPVAEHEVRGLVERDLVPAEEPQPAPARIAARRSAIASTSTASGCSPSRPEQDRLVGAVPATRRAERPVQLGADAGHARRAAPWCSSRSANWRAARIGPTVCELDGPMPILNRSKALTAKRVPPSLGVHCRPARR